MFQLVGNYRLMMLQLGVFPPAFLMECILLRRLLSDCEEGHPAPWLSSADWRSKSACRVRTVSLAVR